MMFGCSYLYFNDGYCFYGLCTSMGTDEFLGSNSNWLSVKEKVPQVMLLEAIVVAELETAMQLEAQHPRQDKES